MAIRRSIPDTLGISMEKEIWRSLFGTGKKHFLEEQYEKVETRSFLFSPSCFLSVLLHLVSLTRASRLFSTLLRSFGLSRKRVCFWVAAK